MTGTASSTTARENGTWRKNDVHARTPSSPTAALNTARYSSFPAPANRLAYAPFTPSDTSQASGRRR